MIQGIGRLSSEAAMLRGPRLVVSALATLALSGAPAAAHGHGGHGGHFGGHHGGGFHHFHHGFHHFHGGFFRPFWFGPTYWPPPYYSVPAPGQCRVFQGDALIAGTNQPFFGTACWQPDGMWHIVP